jgi:succinate dehydrogenase / fumarate reductase, cytochrome b subunit
LSLESHTMFKAFNAVVSHWFVKLSLLGLLWGYVHHLLAGIRHLALDMDTGTDLETARATSQAVFWSAIAITVAAGVMLW